MSELPIVTLVEYEAPELTEAEARSMAERATELLSGTAGLLAVRFFGDFQTGHHCYLLVWADQPALDSYLASEQMLQVRLTVQHRVVDRPTRRVMRDYTPPGGDA